MNGSDQDIVNYDVVLIPAEEGGFTVIVPALPGCISEGETEEEALENIRDAIEGWLVVANRHGLDIPFVPRVKLITVGVAA